MSGRTIGRSPPSGQGEQPVHRADEPITPGR